MGSLSHGFKKKLDAAVDSLGDPAGASVSADIAANKADIAAIDVVKPRQSTAALADAADAGAVVALVCTGAPLWLVGVTLEANGVITEDLTSITIRLGETANLHELIDSTLGAKANIDADGERVVAAEGTVPVRLDVGDEVVAVLAGSGDTAVDHTLSALWHGTAAASALGAPPA